MESASSPMIASEPPGLADSPADNDSGPQITQSSEIEKGSAPPKAAPDQAQLVDTTQLEARESLHPDGLSSAAKAALSEAAALATPPLTAATKPKPQRSGEIKISPEAEDEASLFSFANPTVDKGAEEQKVAQNERSDVEALLENMSMFAFSPEKIEPELESQNPTTAEIELAERSSLAEQIIEEASKTEGSKDETSSSTGEGNNSRKTSRADEGTDDEKPSSRKASIKEDEVEGLVFWEGNASGGSEDDEDGDDEYSDSEEEEEEEEEEEGEEEQEEEEEETPEVIEDGAALTIRGMLDVAVYGNDEPEPSHDEDDESSESDLSHGLPEFSDSDVTESDDGSEDEYEERLNYDEDENGDEDKERRDTIHQDSLLAQAEQFIGYAQIFTLITMIDVNWPDIFTSTFGWLTFFYFDLDITFLFAHIDPDYKRIGDLMLQILFPFFVGYVMIWFWPFKKSFSQDEIQRWASYLTLKGMIVTTLTYTSLAGIVAGGAIAVMRYVDEAKGGDALWGGLSVLAFLWFLHMVLVLITRNYLMERSHFIKPKMVAKEISNMKFSLCLFLLLVTYLPTSALILLGLQPVFRQSWEEKGFREVSCYFKVLPPVAHPVPHHDSHAVLDCLSYFGMGLFTLCAFLIPFYVIALPYFLYSLIVMTRNMIIEQGWLREYFLFAEQQYEVGRHLSFLPTKTMLKFRLGLMVSKLPEKHNVEDEIKLLSSVEVDDFDDVNRHDHAGHGHGHGHGHGEITLNRRGQGAGGGGAELFSSAPPPGLQFDVDPDEYRMLSIREKREQSRLRKLDVRRVKRVRAMEKKRVKRWRQELKKRQREQAKLDDFNKNPERRDFYVKLAKMEPLVHLEYLLAQIMELEGLRQFKKSLSEFEHEHLIENDKVPLDTSGTLYLFKAYEYEYYFWKVFEMGERLTLQSLVLCFSEDRAGQIISVVVVLCIGLAISLRYRPYIDPVQDQIDLVCRTAHVFNGFLALAAYLDYLDPDKLGALLLLVNINAMLLLAYLFRVYTWPRTMYEFYNSLKDSYVINFMFANLLDKRLTVMRKWDSAISFWRKEPALNTPVHSFGLPDNCAHAPCYRWSIFSPVFKRQRFRNRGRHLLLKWDDHLGVRRPFHKLASKEPGLYLQTKWAAHRRLNLSRARFGAGVSLLHIAMARPEVESAKWLLDYDVRDEMYKVRDFDGNTAFMGAVEELSALLQQIEETPQGEFRRVLQTRRSKFARLMLSKQVLGRRVAWDKHDFARLDDLARDLTLAFNKLPFRARNRVCQWRRWPPAIQAFLCQMYLGSHPHVRLHDDYLGPELGMHFAVALQTNRNVVFAEVPFSNMRTEAAKTAASAIGDKIERCAVTALDLRGNSVGSDAAIMLAKAIKRTKCLKYLNLEGNNIGREAGKRIATSLRKWDNTVACVNVARNQLGFDAGYAFATTIKRRGSTIRGINVAGNRMGAQTGMAMAASLWKKSCHITYLDVSNNQLGEEAGKAFALAIKRNKILAALYIGDNQLGEAAGLLIAKALRINTTLTMLDLRANKLGEPFGTMFSAVLRRNETLTQVNLQTNGFRYEVGVQLAEAFITNHTVTAFDLSDNELNAEAGDVLAAGVKDPDCVWTDLNLAGNEVDDGGGKAIAAALKQNRTITRLDMSRNKMGAHAGKKLGRALRAPECPLCSLSMVNCDLGPKGAESIALALESNAKLEYIDLEGNRFGDAGIKQLAMALESNTAVTALSLANNQLGKEGGKMVAAALVMNSSLTSINLRGNGIGPAAGEAIAAELEVNNNIIFIDLEDNNLDPWFGRRLADSMFTNQVLHTVILAHNRLGHERKDGPAPVQAGRAIVEILPRRTCGVTYLDLGYNRLGPRAALAVADMLKTKTNVVTTLLLAGNFFGEDAGEKLCEALHANNLLTELDLGSNRMGTKSGVMMASVLDSNATLTSLSLTKNGMGSIAGLALTAALQHNIALTSCDMSTNNFGPRPCVGMAAVIRNNKTLKHLDIGSNALGSGEPEESLILAESLRKNKHLLFLDVNNNRLGRNAGHVFASALLRNRTIEALGLTNNRFDASAGFALLTALKKNHSLTHLFVKESEVGREAFADIQKEMAKRFSRRRRRPEEREAAKNKNNPTSL